MSSAFLLIVATGVVVWVTVAVARTISAAHLDRALRAQAPTPQDVAAVMSDARAGTPNRPLWRAVPAHSARRTA